MENNWSEVELNLYGLVAGREGGVLLANIYSEECSIFFLLIYISKLVRSLEVGQISGSVSLRIYSLENHVHVLNNKKV